MALERRQLIRQAGVLGVVLWLVCGGPSASQESVPASQPWLPVPISQSFLDDFDRDSLRLALQRSRRYLRRLPSDRLVPFGDRQVTVTRLRDTLHTFQYVLEQTSTPAALKAAITQHFEVFQASGGDHQGRVLFTGYYEMLLDGSLHPTAEFPYPLYNPPPDLLRIDLGLFRPRYRGQRLIARYDDGNVLPYFTRRDIDTEGKLRGRGLELVWLRDAIDGFFLHVQGSGQIRLPTDQTIFVTYAASNGHPYRSIGRQLIKEGHLSADAMSLQTLRQYLRDHPDQRRRILNANPRYIFFSRAQRGPRGSLNVVLVPGRSIATDARLFPPAGLAFIRTQQPIIDPHGTITGWKPLTRFVFNHDRGSAITGPGRVDLYWGSGAQAELAAGHLKHPGQLFFLLKRTTQSPHTDSRED